MRNKFRKIVIITLAIFFITAKAFSANETGMNQEDIKEKLVGVEANFTSDGFFYVYDDNGSRLNHKVPCGWMGDYGDISLKEKWEDNPQSGMTCMKWTYTAESKQGKGWGGVYWITPHGHCEEVREDGLDLRQAKRITLWARGEQGNEKIKIKVGGLGGQFPDSGTKTSEVLKLSKNWQQFSLSLEGLDISYINGIFCWLADKQWNLDGCVFYLDNIRYEK